MIYWHVEKKSLCVYSQLKSSSASEVAAMIEGVLRHCTDVEIDRQYTDTHGASIVGFAFAHVLGFNLLPRLKNVGSARLYRPADGEDEKWPNLAPVLSSKTIDWDLIGQQYDQIVKVHHRPAPGHRGGRAGPAALHPRRSKASDIPGDRGTGPRGTYGVHLRLPRPRGEVAEAAHRRRPAGPVPAVLDPREPLRPLRA
jgi:Tn3 transposase DDE domain